MKFNIIKKGFILLSAFSLVTFTACTDLEPQEEDSIVIESTGGWSSLPVILLNCWCAAYNDLSAFTDQC